MSVRMWLNLGNPQTIQWRWRISGDLPLNVRRGMLESDVFSVFPELMLDIAEGSEPTRLYWLARSWGEA